MTATNHALTGAVVALAVKQPALAIPLAFLSHLVLDAIPHYEAKGVKSGFNSGIEKTKLKSFRIFLLSDLSICLLLILVLPFWLDSKADWWVVMACMILAISPDATWGWHLYRAKIGKKVTSYTAFTRFHAWVQWMEKPWGIWVEVAWLLFMIWLIIVIMH